MSRFAARRFAPPALALSTPPSGDEVVVLPRHSVLVLAGAARRDWMHGIDRTDTADETATRLSATFRTLAG